MAKPTTREEAEKLLGKRTPIVSGKGGDYAGEPKKAASAPTSEGLLKRTLRERMEKEGVEYASGGMVRGCGAATSGKGFRSGKC